MGMYDYLNGEQVKCFSIPLSYIEKNENNEDTVCLTSMGGLLEVYNKGDEVPYRSTIYNYGEDFIVYDYRGYSDSIYVHIIKNGKVSDYFKLSELPKLIPVLPVINNQGDILKISSRDDYFNISKDYKEYIDNKYFNGLKQIRHLFDEYIELLRQGIEETDLKADYYKKLELLRKDTVDIFVNKWYKSGEELRDFMSNDIGWLVGSLKDSTKDDKEKDKILSLYKEQCATFDKDVEEYKEWVSGYHTAKEIDVILKL